jgi:hypothetical protein
MLESLPQKLDIVAGLPLQPHRKPLMQPTPSRGQKLSFGG